MRGTEMARLRIDMPDHVKAQTQVGTVFPFIRQKLQPPGILNQPQTPELCKHGLVAAPQPLINQTKNMHASSFNLLAPVLQKLREP